jgi:3-deoxy-7-phosphoheptulonate synthase
VLSTQPPLVRADDLDVLRTLLARVAAGQALVVQAGDCAEDPDECTEEHIRRKVTVLDLLASTLRATTGKPVVRVGRIAGQFAKPRSGTVEAVGDRLLPVYRGHLVNGPEPDWESRRADPLRILLCYMAASAAAGHLGWRAPAPGRASDLHGRVWTSHEALLLDYELPLTRQTADGRRWLGSTHWPWIGERTRQPDGAHVDLLAGVVNPVACKVGPGADLDGVLDLCARLDPFREPGRLTLIARMGATAVIDRLPPLVGAVRAAGHRPVWLCDPMHGNTVAASGRKVRLLDTMIQEVHGFRRAVALAGGVAGGLHLETTPDDVAECVADASALPADGRSTSLCDPRLNPEQAVALVSAWACPT